MSGRVLGVAETLAALKGLQEKIMHGATVGVNRAALYGERQAKDYLRAKVYSQPERGYRRTGTLRRSVHAALPSKPHDGDEGEAHAGEELSGVASSGHATEETEGLILTQVGTWISYADIVEKRTPYMQPTSADIERYLPGALSVALDQAIGTGGGE